MTTAVRPMTPSIDWLPWGLLVAGILLLYGPSFYGLATTLWTTDRQAHGPIVLGVALWFFWFKGRQLRVSQAAHRPNRMAGLALLTLGLALYVLGRSQGILLLEIGSLIPVLLGVTLLCLGAAVVRQLWFAFFFLLFVIPLPASLVDAVTQPMKIAVSIGSEHVLAALGYPVARQGVMLYVGPYQLLVADACAGLNSLFTLEALGLLYMNVNRQTSVARNAILATLIVPISYTSNVVRVITLALITYHLGDEAGQGFLHGFSGMVLFLTALMLIVGVDALLRRLFTSRAVEREPRAMNPASTTLPLPGLPKTMMLVAAMAVAATAALALAPRPVMDGPAPQLAQTVPTAFGPWRQQNRSVEVASVTDGTETALDQPYDQTLLRSYVNVETGDVVMLALAWGRHQRQDVKVHRPEVCYPAQGYTMLAPPRDSTLTMPGQANPITVRTLLTRQGSELETVRYWIRIGSQYGGDSLAMRWYLLREGLDGRIRDGMLVRASQRLPANANAARSNTVMDGFLRDLVAAVPAETRRMLVQ